MKKKLGFAMALALSLLSTLPAVSSADPKDCPTGANCSLLDSGDCIYSWDPDSSCCIAPPIDLPPYQIQCPMYCC